MNPLHPARGWYGFSGHSMAVAMSWSAPRCRTIRRIDRCEKLSGKVIVGMGGPGRVRLNVRWLSLKVRLGKKITWTVWEVFRFTGGRIVERWGIHNLREQINTAAGLGRAGR